jgi:hypothetical protein
MNDMNTVLIHPHAILVEQCFEEYGFYGDFCKERYPEVTSAGRFFTDVSRIIDSDGIEISAEIHQALKCLSSQVGFLNKKEIDSIGLIVEVIKSALAYRKRNRIAENGKEFENFIKQIKKIKKFLDTTKPYGQGQELIPVPISLKQKNLEIPTELANRFFSEIGEYVNEIEDIYEGYMNYDEDKWKKTYGGIGKEKVNEKMLKTKYEKQLMVNFLKFIKYLHPLIGNENEDNVSLTSRATNTLIARVFQLSGLRPRFTAEQEFILCNDLSAKHKDKPFEEKLLQAISSLRNGVLKDLELEGRKI